MVGAGVIPDVTLARNAGLEIGESGGVRGRLALRDSVPGVFAAGDIAEYDSVIHGRPMRIEHWDVAFNQGKTAALNMLGRDQPHDVVPYFFSDLSDWASLEYVGPGVASGTRRWSGARSTRASSRSSTSTAAASRRRCRWGARTTSSTPGG